MGDEDQHCDREERRAFSESVIWAVIPTDRRTGVSTPPPRLQTNEEFIAAVTFRREEEGMQVRTRLINITLKVDLITT